MSNRVRTAVFPVAGLGTRFLPATKSVPKEIITLVDRPLVQYAIDEARAAGIEEFIFVTSRGKSALEDYFDSAPQLEDTLARKGKHDLLDTLRSTNMESGAIAYVRQTQPQGLGHAVWCARRMLGDEPFAVILPDDVICSRQNPVSSRWSRHMSGSVATWLPQWKSPKKRRHPTGSLISSRTWARSSLSREW